MTELTLLSVSAGADIGRSVERESSERNGSFVLPGYCPVPLEIRYGHLYTCRRLHGRLVLGQVRLLHRKGNERLPRFVLLKQARIRILLTASWRTSTRRRPSL